MVLTNADLRVFDDSADMYERSYHVGHLGLIDENIRQELDDKEDAEVLQLFVGVFGEANGRSCDYSSYSK